MRAFGHCPSGTADGARGRRAVGCLPVVLFLGLFAALVVADRLSDGGGCALADAGRVLR